ncbi:type VII secretion protein EccCa [Saccharothrix australiensis]|uniref:S-DNA-T family DNA segregation ATPase FtsK/SpoIIIE n=1 Tax=Saccharothrix australiensis TaxID=2072 RepID=A0A495W7Z6_9PSEU|nr:type VII secretion protein EccCa [Saccharothrix australiensis]RKT56743.1 S-DNA-T family DNA segregation ATPase FtsK/SpoIIIE [Saccharothrix australiensis]
MSTVTVKRPPRADGPAMPEGQVQLEEPPVMTDEAPQDLTSVMMYLPMGIGAISMVLIYSLGNGSPVMYIVGGAMAVSMLFMSLSQIGRAGAERKKQLHAERRDYLRYIAQLRARARDTAHEQRRAVLWNNPDPARLWSIATGARLWERRGSHEDFGRVRIGLGSRPAVLEFLPPSTKPIEDLEPLSSVALRRFGEAYRVVNGIPTSVGMRSFTSVELTGDITAALGLARAVLAQLVTFHAPDELRVAVLTPEASRPEWDWVKWLPHNAHPTARDAAGPVRMLACDHDELMALLGTEVTDRGDHDKAAPVGVNEPFVVVVAHLGRIPEHSRLHGAGLRNVVLLDITGEMTGGPKVLRLTAKGTTVEFPSGDAVGVAECDRISTGQAETLARVLAPKRTSGTIDVVDGALEADIELTTLLGIRDARTFDVPAQWRPRNALRSRMSVPIGVTGEGEVIELDLKEPAQGGVGPHGMLIGATGSGKSELLRTLVCALAATHSSEILNFVLVDFKGGATFLGMDRLPHTSAMITNLADELVLVDRMQDAINGELTRRQELLRAGGFVSLFEYEKARAAGRQLAPFPVLFVIVDEFSELLSSKPEFMDLFVSIGRLGRSLGVHLLLASQRIDEGRINRVEGHLSYRIALRTFSSMESRSVIGVADAYQLPPEPGNGYLKLDTTNLLRFKSAYVSGDCPVPAVRDGQAARSTPLSLDVLPFTTQPHPLAHVLAAEEEPAAGDGADAGDEEPAAGDEDEESLADVLIARLVGAGPPARQVWLPPLAESPSLDSLLPGVLPDPVRGMVVADDAGFGRLRVPVGLVDRPQEQVRELMVADLSGADGHVAIVGAPQTGKSTLLRTLVLALAMTHTPREVQFYCLDFGGGGIMSVSGLPHVGSVATRLDRDRVVRTIEELMQVLEQREATFAEHGVESIGAYRAMCARGEVDDPHGDVFLVVDGWFSLRQDYDDLETRINELASRGLSYGVHVVVVATRWSEIRPWLRDLLGTRFELRLGDSMESEVASRKAATVPAQPGRGLTSSGDHFLAALPRMDGGDAADLTAATKAIAEEAREFWPGRPVPPVRMLPTSLPRTDLPAPEGEVLRACLGLDEQRLNPVWHDFGVTPHLLVFGDAETGKTNALRLVLDAVTRRYAPDEAKILLGDSARRLDELVPEEYRTGYAVTSDALHELAEQASVSLGRRVPGPEVRPDELRARGWWQGPELFIVVDDYEMLGRDFGGSSALEPLLPLLAQGVHIGFHLIVARTSAGGMRAMMDPVVRRLWELATPALLFSYPKEEGGFLGEAKPRTLPAGRAQLVTRRGIRLVQTAFVDAPGGGPVDGARASGLVAHRGAVES